MKIPKFNIIIRESNRIALKFNFKIPNKDREELSNKNLSSLTKNYSIEVMPRTAEKITDFTAILPKNTYIYVAHLEGTEISSMLATSKRLERLGYNVVPHFPARIIDSKNLLEVWLKNYSDIGIKKGLILAGSPKKAIGEFEDSMGLLSTGLFDKYGFNELFCAGHPEGNKDIDLDGSEINLMEAIRWKHEFSHRTQIPISLTTQFCFDIEPIARWEKRLTEANINMPLNIGVAGPAKLQTMIKYALMCGVGPSIRVLEKRAKDLTKLLLPYSPIKFLKALSDYKDRNIHSKINSTHFFPLGGIIKTTEFLSKINKEN